MRHTNCACVRSVFPQVHLAILAWALFALMSRHSERRFANTESFSATVVEEPLLESRTEEKSAPHYGDFGAPKLGAPNLHATDFLRESTTVGWGSLCGRFGQCSSLVPVALVRRFPFQELFG